MDLGYGTNFGIGKTTVVGASSSTSSGPEFHSDAAAATQKLTTALVRSLDKSKFDLEKIAAVGNNNTDTTVTKSLEPQPPMDQSLVPLKGPFRTNLKRYRGRSSSLADLTTRYSGIVDKAVVDKAVPAVDNFKGVV